MEKINTTNTESPIVHVVDKYGLRITTVEQLLTTVYPQLSKRDVDTIINYYRQEEVIEMMAAQIKLLHHSASKLTTANKRLTSKLKALLQGKLFKEGE